MVVNDEIISWAESRTLTDEILDKFEPLDVKALAEIKTTTGVFALSYEGEELGFGLWNSKGPKIVFVAGAGSEALRHLESGRTGYSTLRRSLAALLCEKYNLLPIPRTLDESDADRFDNYALAAVSDDILTNWIQKNMKIAILPLAKEVVNATKQGLIDYNVPLFNLQNNPANNYGAEIKKWRKKCAAKAKENINKKI